MRALAEEPVPIGATTRARLADIPLACSGRPTGTLGRRLGGPAKGVLGRAAGPFRELCLGEGRRAHYGPEQLDVGLGVAVVELLQVDRAPDEGVVWLAWKQVHVQVRQGVAVDLVVHLDRMQPLAEGPSDGHCLAPEGGPVGSG